MVPAGGSLRALAGVARVIVDYTGFAASDRARGRSGIARAAVLCDIRSPETNLSERTDEWEP